MWLYRVSELRSDTMRRMPVKKVASTNRTRIPWWKQTTTEARASFNAARMAQISRSRSVKSIGPCGRETPTLCQRTSLSIG